MSLRSLRIVDDQVYLHSPFALCRLTSLLAQGVCMLKHQLLDSSESHSLGYQVRVPENTTREESSKMLFGLLYSLNKFIAKLEPQQSRSKGCSFIVMRTTNYKLHSLKAPTGIHLLLTTDVSPPSYRVELLECLWFLSHFLPKAEETHSVEFPSDICSRLVHLLIRNF